MSQAHYVRCGHTTPAFSADSLSYAHDVQCSIEAVAVVHMPYFLSPKYPMCVKHMIQFFDKRDADEIAGNPFRHSEPTRLEWVWDAGTRECVLHGWPAVLCEGWTEEHRALRRRGLFAASPTAGGV